MSVLVASLQQLLCFDLSRYLEDYIYSGLTEEKKVKNLSAP